MDPRRPSLGVRPCVVCGAPVDALRAPHVVVTGNEPAPVCSGECRARWDRGERAPARLPTPPTARPAPRSRAAPRLGDLDLPLSPLALSVLALLVSPFATSRAVALVTALLAAASAVDLAVRSAKLCAPKAPLPLAALGVGFIAFGAYRSFDEVGSVGLIGAAFAAVAVAGRFTLWAMRQEPLEREADTLAESLEGALPPGRAESYAATIRGRERVAPATRFAMLSIRAGITIVGVVAGLLLFFPPKSGAAVSVIGAVFVSLPLLAPIAATARAHLDVSLRAAARGIFFDGPIALERFGQVTHAIFPMHGTLTLPRAELSGIRLVGDAEGSEDELLTLVTSAEAAAGTHPIALACRAECQRRGLDVPLARRARALEGRGVVSLAVTGEDVVVGHRALLLSEGVSVARADEAANEIEASGDTAVFVAVMGRVRGVLAFRYPVRDGVAEALAQLKALDVDATLLSGDHHATAEALAKSLEIPHVRSELQPSEKLAELGRIQESTDPVVVIEHADAATSLLPAARLSVRLGGAGKIGGHGVSTLEGDPRLAAEAIALARRLRRSMILSGVLIAVLGLPTLILAVFFDLSPALAALVPLCVEAFVHPTGARAR